MCCISLKQQTLELTISGGLTEGGFNITGWTSSQDTKKTCADSLWQMRISSALEGDLYLVLKDVLVGILWICNYSLFKERSKKKKVLVFHGLPGQLQCTLGFILTPPNDNGGEHRTTRHSRFSPVKNRSRSGDCKDGSISFTSFSYSEHSVGMLASRKRQDRGYVHVMLYVLVLRQHHAVYTLIRLSFLAHAELSIFIFRSLKVLKKAWKKGVTTDLQGPNLLLASHINFFININ